MTVLFCRSRNGGRRCTRELGHAGLHRHRTIMWADAGADDPPDASRPASVLPARLRTRAGTSDACREGRDHPTASRLAEHDTAGAASAQESRDRAEWFNAHGWSEGSAAPQ